MDYISEIHNEILDIMDCIHSICDQNKIKYYIVGGTLLGAARHKGFIPWDDDLDIAMRREDFNHFIDIASSCLPTNLRVRWITTDKDYYLPFAKVENLKTVFADTDLFDAHKQMGIFVDIFPIDEIREINKSIIIRKRIIRTISSIRYYKMISWKSSIPKKLLSYVIAPFFSQKLLSDIQLRIMTKDNGKNYLFSANYGSNYPIQKRSFAFSELEDVILLDFEKRKYYAPKNYDTVLKKIFGNDYLKLPSEDKRITHHPKFVRFSNGNELFF